MASSDVISESKDAVQDTSSEVAFEEFKLQNTTAAIYVLDKTLCGCAVELKKFLIKDCTINVCDHWSKHIGNTIAETSTNFEDCENKSSHTYKIGTSTDVSIRDYGYLERLIAEAKRRVEGRGLHHDVIILLGHSSVLLAEDKDLIETFAKLYPTIIAFIGCCGGNTRYGPILTMSYLLPNTSEFLWEIFSPIIGFYQRQIYTDELENTSLIIGLRYYLNIRYDDEVGGPQYRGTDIARCAFALAKLNKSVLRTDPTVFINDREGKNPVQMILHKCDLTTEAVPLSCMQLAMYSPMVVSSKEFKSFTIEETPKIARRIIPTITLPKESCLEHKLVIDDVLRQLDQQKIEITMHGGVQKIEITMHGAVQKIKIEQLVYKGEVMIEVSETLPTQITISEGRTPQLNVKSNSLQGINITSPHYSEIEHKWTHGMIITLAAGRVKIIKDNDKTIKLCPYLYCHTYMCMTQLVSQDADKQEIRLISQDLPKVQLEGITVDELSGVCGEKIEELQLNKIIPLVCEIKFIKLFNKTLELLRKGVKSSWKEIDPLQFLVAVLRGHWGKNNITCIKKWATFHLMQITKKVKNNSKLSHQYKLCCVCFVLLCEDSFVRFDEKDQHCIIVCTKQGNELVNVTVITDELSKELPYPGGPFPSDGELTSWVNLFLRHCKYEPNCYDLYNKSNHPPWTIGNQYRHNPLQQLESYQYSYIEFLLCLGALSDGIQILSGQRQQNKLQKCYDVKHFFNKDEMEGGYMEYFSDSQILAEVTSHGKEFHIDGVSYIETRVLLNREKVYGKIDDQLFSLYKNKSWLDNQHNAIRNALRQVQEEKGSWSENWKKVSSCRFVFAQFMTQSKSEIKGILFYTDTHYGHNLIELNKEVLETVAAEKTCTAKCFDKTKIKEILTQIEQNRVLEHDLIPAIKELCKCRLCQRGMLEITIKQMDEAKKFPFIKVGRLTLKYNSARQLINVQLEHCAEYTNTDEQ